ncbi:MAG TPA: glycosyltransferase family 2 protein, partial [Vicinamibacterales bacterium]|nr:glycosyltransferase family 2 protein [Vicinamibacterales bacterium]
MKASIAIRSHKRVDALCEAIERIVTQDYPDLEIVVVEQSGVLTPSQDQRLAALQSDPRLRVYKRPPLGAAAARNEAVRLSRGDVIVFLDDDDLPRDNGWLSALMRNFDDPKCLGASGRHVVPGGRQPPYLAMQYARRSVLSYSFLKWPRTYVRVDTRSPSVQSLMGTNGSVRRSAVERFGLWDECTPIEEEA